MNRMTRMSIVRESILRHSSARLAIAYSIENAVRYYYALRFYFFGFWFMLLPIRKDFAG